MANFSTFLTQGLWFFLCAMICDEFSALAMSQAEDVDVEMKSFEVLPIDRETCLIAGDCDDWCKEKGQKDTRNCVCRCERWITESDFNCPNGTTYCQARILTHQQANYPGELTSS